MAQGGFISSPSVNPTPDLTYKITYVTDFGSVDNKYASVVTQSIIPNLTQKGYVFEGWFYDSSYTIAVEIGDSITESKTFYAKWRESLNIDLKVKWIIN